jgi:hypothetical protein
MNLHSYFDSIALDQDPVNRIERPLNDSFRKGLEDQARQIMQSYPASEMGDLLNIKDAKTWGVEAYKLAVEHIYSYTQTHKQVTEEYQTSMRALLMKQIALGGYRLGLNIAAIYA